MPSFLTNKVSIMNIERNLNYLYLYYYTKGFILYYRG
jgi:hypothetical protein